MLISPTHFCHACKVLRSHQCISLKHALPCAPFLLSVWPPVPRMSPPTPDSWRLTSRQPAAVGRHAWMFPSPANSSSTISQQVSLSLPTQRCCKHVISHRASSGAAGCHRLLHRKDTTFCPVPPASSL